MKNSTKVTYLIENGISLKTISKMNQNQITLMVERFKKFKKEESMEQVTKTTEPAKEIINIGTQGGELPNNPTGKGYKVEKNSDGTTKATPMETEMKEDDTDDVTSSNALGKDAEQTYTGQDSPHDANDMADDGMDDDSGNNRSNMGMAESTISEKFESKAQQGLFWARCEECSNKNCKWCKMAKEFSDKTTKKDYENMPDQVSEGFYDLFRKKTPNQIDDSKLKNEFKNFIVKYSKIKDIESDIEDWSDKKIIDQIKGYSDMSKQGSTHNKRAKELFSKLFEKKKEKTNESEQKEWETIILEMLDEEKKRKFKKQNPDSDSMILRKPKKMTMFSDEAPMELPIAKMFSIGKK